MKSIIFFTILLIIFLSLTIENSYSQITGECLTTQLLHQSDHDSIPAYLQNGWNQQKTVPLAVVYFDFPDGRFNSNGVSKQPFLTSELSTVANFDAVGEIGLTFDNSPYYVSNNLYTNAAKYNRSDRWNMLFDSPGVYYGTANPDIISNKAKWNFSTLNNCNVHF